ncbi:hypothetical protein [Cupriavidus consociatus]|uniref:hypothetical protein n=1 Tax=Cupriavidus consociatus TaxID=2821357 RepID=UPI001AE90940|nr:MULTISPECIES: hypothetical protein [unclassified Cupriavidus]MBP0621003.1 hypothetical protein [Cupriavidus sp. LEh25]MDK2657672.1 hypothetical protein [Cupriavidus sp. LEh21]
MLKNVLSLIAAIAALGAGVAHAGIGMRDVYTDGAVKAQEPPYTNGGRASTGRRDVFTDGARITNRDGYIEERSQK